MSTVLETPVMGVQEPRILHLPPAVTSSSGIEAVELCRMAGLILDPWEEFVLDKALGERADGRWAALEVGVMVSRQNGKGAILEARELAGLFLLGETFITHSAHQFDTSLEAFRRLLMLIEDNHDFARQVKRVSRSHGEEGIELLTGQRIRFRTRTKGGGRGFSGDCVILDEAMDLSLSAHGALLPTLSARPNPQVWYTGSAVDQNVHAHGEVFARIRERGHTGQDPELAYFEWSADTDLEHADEVADDPETWAVANPALGIRITEGFVALERRSMHPRTFAVERLGVGDWPDLGGVKPDDLTLEMWEACTDPSSRLLDPVRLAVDVTPDRKFASIAAAGRRSDGLLHVEIVDRRPGTGWLAARVAEVAKRNRAGAVIYDTRSPAAAIAPAMVTLGVKLEPVGSKEHADGCGMLYDDVDQGRLRHLGTPELSAAVRGAAKRPYGDAWTWSRKNSAVDISPLVAVTLARWGVGTAPRALDLGDYRIGVL